IEGGDLLGREPIEQSCGHLASGMTGVDEAVQKDQHRQADDILESGMEFVQICWITHRVLVSKTGRVAGSMTSVRAGVEHTPRGTRPLRDLPNAPPEGLTDCAVRAFGVLPPCVSTIPTVVLRGVAAPPLLIVARSHEAHAIG